MKTLMVRTHFLVPPGCLIVTFLLILNKSCFIIFSALMSNIEKSEQNSSMSNQNTINLHIKKASAPIDSEMVFISVGYRQFNKQVNGS